MDVPAPSVLHLIFVPVKKGTTLQIPQISKAHSGNSWGIRMQNLGLGGAWVALSGCEGGDGCGSMGAALPGQEYIGVRLKKGSDNQHGVGEGVGGFVRV